MDILVKLEGDVTYAKLDIPEVQNNILDDLRRSVSSNSQSEATNKVIKKGVYKKTPIQFSVYLCAREPLSPTIVHKWGFNGVL